MDRHLRIELLGGLRVCGSEGQVTRFRTRKTASLLGLLAYRLNERHCRDEVVERLWCDVDAERGRHSLRQALHSLRCQLEPPGMSPGAVLLATYSHIQLNPATVTTDLSELDAAVAAIPDADSGGDRLAALLRAAGLYAGPLLPGCSDDWVGLERMRREAEQVSMLRRLAKEYVRLGQLQAALDTLLRARSLAPDSDGTCRDVMKAYAALGKPLNAIEHFHALEVRLKRDTGSEPSKATIELAARIRSGIGSVGRMPRYRCSPFVATIAPPATARALRSAVPEQRGNATGGCSYGAALARRPSRLPAGLTPFFGREDQLAQLTGLLCPAGCEEAARSAPGRGRQVDGQERLITLVAPDGFGKTRLAVEVGARLADRLDGGAVFVPLTDVAEPGGVINAILHALGADCAPAASPCDRLAAELTGRDTLLILDDAGRLAADPSQNEGSPASRQMGFAALVETLLQRAPGLRCLVTSCVPLDVGGEIVAPVAPLPTPPAPGTPERLLEFPSVRLFVDRAQRTRCDFQITRSNAAGIAALCECLEGIPLAIELAAGRSLALTPRQIVEQLCAGVDLLAPVKRAESQRSLRQTIANTVGALPPDVQRFFAALSVFRGGWTLAAATAVCAERRDGEGAAQALERLEQLVARNLVSAYDEGDVRRFGVLEVLRSYAAEQLEPGLRDALVRRHTAYFVAFAEAAGPELRSARVQIALASLDQERANLRAALDAADNPDEALSLAAALWRYWLGRGELREGRDRLQAALAAVAAACERETTAGSTLSHVANGALHGVRSNMSPTGVSYTVQIRYGAVDAAAPAETVAPHPGATLGARDGSSAPCDRSHLGATHAEALCGLGLFARDLGEHEAAARALNESLRRFRAIGDLAGAAQALNGLAVLADRGDDVPAARRYFDESMALRRQAGDHWAVAATLNNIGRLDQRLGDLDAACRAYRDSAALFRAAGDWGHAAIASNNLGSAASDRGDYEQARASFEQSLSLFRAARDRTRTAVALHNLGETLYRLGDARAAERHLRESIALDRENGNTEGCVRNLASLGNVAAVGGDADRAVRLISAAFQGLEENSISLPPAQRERLEQDLEAARRGLSAREYLDACEFGRAMPLDVMIAFALNYNAAEVTSEQDRTSPVSSQPRSTAPDSTVAPRLPR